MLSTLETVDVRTLTFDRASAARQPDEVVPGLVRPLSAITGNPIPAIGIGLRYPLQSICNKTLGQPAESLSGARLILMMLRESDEKVMLFLAGSRRDFATAFNRVPELFRKKVRTVYINAGNGPDRPQWEWNANLASCLHGPEIVRSAAVQAPLLTQKPDCYALRRGR